MSGRRCEVCEGKVEKTCGYDDGPMLDFCTEDYIEHLESAHPQNEAAQIEAKELREKLKRSERILRRRRALMPDYDRKLEEWLK